MVSHYGSHDFTVKLGLWMNFYNAEGKKSDAVLCPMLLLVYIFKLQMSSQSNEISNHCAFFKMKQQRKQFLKRPSY